MGENFQIFSWIISVFVMPFAIYVQNQILKSKEDREKLQLELHEHKIFCLRNFSQSIEMRELKQEIKDLREEIRKDLADFKQELTKNH